MVLAGITPGVHAGPFETTKEVGKTVKRVQISNHEEEIEHIESMQVGSDCRCQKQGHAHQLNNIA